MMKKTSIFLYILIFLFIGLGLFSCSKKQAEPDKIIIETFDYDINRSKSSMANELSYDLSFKINFSLNQKFDVDDLTVIISQNNTSDYRKSFSFDIDYSNTENIIISSSKEEYPYILLKYAIVDTTSLNAEARIKITSKDLMEDINDFIQIACYCKSKAIIDENNLLNDGIFKMNYSDDELIHYEFDEFNESYKIISVIVKSDTFEIPKTYEGYPVKSIGEGAFYGRSSLKNIIIPDSVTTIADDAFEGCDNIEKATIPASAILFIPNKKLKEVNITSGTSIAEDAFYGCSNLTSISIPKSVTSIGWNAFSDCVNLKKATIPASVIPFIPKGNLQELTITSGTKIEKSDLSNCKNLTTITLPFVGAAANGTENTHFGYIFGASSYSDNSQYVPSSLKKVVITGGTSIDSSAFYGCSSLTSIEIPNSITSIGTSAFTGCTRLIYNVFNNGNYLGNEKNPYLVFIKATSKDIATCEINSNTKIIYSNALQDCKEITSVVIPNSVIVIGEAVLSGCDHLSSITLPFLGSRLNATTNTCLGYIFGASTYSDNSKYVPSSLKEVVITKDSGIISSAFEDCSNLESITIPASTTLIGENAFKNCSSLTNVYYEGTIEDWCNIVFCYNIYSNPMVEADHFYLKNSSNEWEEVTSIEIPNTIEKIDEYQFAGFNNVTMITIPDNIKSIGVSAFDNCSSLKSIEIPTGVTSIGNWAFNGCSSLGNIKILGNVTSIGNWAFNNCSNLTSFTIGNSVTSIGEGAFVGCYKLLEVYNLSSLNIVKGDTSNGYAGYYAKAIHTSLDEESNLILKDDFIFYKDDKYYLVGYQGTSTDIVLPNDIDGNTYEIKDYAFYNRLDLTNIVIPNSITSIGDNAFVGCINLNYTEYDEGCYLGNQDNPYLWFIKAKNNLITSCEVNKATQWIYQSAFADCNSIESIKLPFVGAAANGTENTHFGYIFGASSYSENSTYIPSSLVSITLLDCVTSINDNAFFDCNGLTHVFYEGSLEDWCHIQFKNEYANPMSYASNFYLQNNNEWQKVIDLVIPNTITEINNYQFSGFSNVISITIPESVTSIGEKAFSGCSSLESITIPFVGAKLNGTKNTNFGHIFGASTYNNNSTYVPKSLKEVIITGEIISIGANVFYGCSNLTSITIPESVTSIGLNAFSGCSGLVSMTLPFVGAKLNGIENTHFGYIFGASTYNDNLNKVPNTLKTVTITGGGRIESFAFNSCTNLSRISILNKETIIGQNAFYNCRSLASMTLPFIGASQTETENTHFGYIFGANTYNDNSNYVPKSLKEVTITGGTSIRKSAFSGCNSLTSVTIPNSVTSIESLAFSGCSSLTNVYYEGTLENWINLTLDSSFSNPMSYANHFYLKNSNNVWEEVTSIEIPNTIIEIGAYQFYGFNNAKSITIPNSVKSIGASAFDGCSSLTSVTIPDSVTSIGENAFSSCNHLTSITIPFVGASLNETKNTHIGYIFGATTYSGNSEKIPDSLKEVTITNGTSIDSNAFSSCSSLTSITIPESVTKIGESSFYNCNSLTSIVISKNVTSIGFNAFAGCNSLESITIPFVGASLTDTENTHFGYIFGATSNLEHLKCLPTSLKEVIITGGVSLGDTAFEDCSSLENITIPSSITNIGELTFNGCSNLTNVYYEGTIEDWCHISFGWSRSNPMEFAQHFYLRNSNNAWEEVTSIEIPNTIMGIGRCQFAGFNNVTSITIPKGVTSIGLSAFYDCSSLESITIPDGVITIGSNAFYNCKSLKNVILPNSVSKIDTFAFFNCSSLESIAIPASLISIDDSVFEGCSSLTSITIPASVTSIGNGAFVSCFRLAEVYNLSSLDIIKGDTSNGCVGYYAKVIHTSLEEESSLITKDDYLFIKDKDNQYYLVGYTGTAKDLVLPNDIEGNTYEINSYAFYSHNDLTSVVVSNGVTNIGESAFKNCDKLVSIVLPNSIESIGNSVFYNCNSLRSIELPNSIISIGEYAFSNCNNLTSITLGNSVKSIESYAFYDCRSLTSIVLPNSVTSIGSNAFFGCYSLVEVYNLSAINVIMGGSDNGYVGYYAKVIHNSIEESNLITNDDYVFYKNNTNKYYLVGYIGTSTNLVLPNDVDGNAYEINKGALASCMNLESITLPFVGAKPNETMNTHFGYIFGASSYEENSIYVPSSLKEVIITGTSIGHCAFYNCSNLTKVLIMDSVTTIGASAFNGCSSLTSIVIPQSVTSMGDSVFANCSSIASLTIPFVGESFGGTENTHFGYIFGASSVSDHLTYVPKNLKEVIITGGTSISAHAFSECGNITNITIPFSITSFSDSAFEFCSNLTNVYYEGSIEDWCKIQFMGIDANPMFYARHLYIRKSNIEWDEVTSIEIPKNMTKIGNYQFVGLKNVTSVTIPTNITSIGEYTFSYSNLASIVIPTSVTSIGKYAFYYCRNLTSVVLPNSITSISFAAFEHCSSLRSIEIPNSVTSIGEWAFNDCINLRSVTIARSVKKIDSYAFYDCRSLTSVVIPTSVTSIGEFAFLRCFRLVEIYNYSSLNITKGSSNNGYAGYYAKVLYNSFKLSNLITKDDYVFIKDDANKYYLVQYNGTETDLVLPKDIEGNNYEINDYAFYNCNSLTSITIPSSVTSIGSFAFSDSRSLTSVTIGSSVTSIGESAFSECSSLTSITIPSSVTSVGINAFHICSSLKEVYYNGTSTEWNNINIKDAKLEITNSTIYYYSETKPTDSGHYWHYVDGVVTKW